MNRRISTLVLLIGALALLAGCSGYKKISPGYAGREVTLNEEYTPQSPFALVRISYPLPALSPEEAPPPEDEAEYMRQYREKQALARIRTGYYALEFHRALARRLPEESVLLAPYYLNAGPANPAVLEIPCVLEVHFDMDAQIKNPDLGNKRTMGHYIRPVIEIVRVEDSSIRASTFTDRWAEHVSRIGTTRAARRVSPRRAVGKDDLVRLETRTFRSSKKLLIQSANVDGGNEEALPFGHYWTYLGNVVCDELNKVDWLESTEAAQASAAARIHGNSWSGRVSASTTPQARFLREALAVQRRFQSMNDARLAEGIYTGTIGDSVRDLLVAETRVATSQEWASRRMIVLGILSLGAAASSTAASAQGNTAAAQAGTNLQQQNLYMMQREERDSEGLRLIFQTTFAGVTADQVSEVSTSMDERELLSLENLPLLQYALVQKYAAQYPEAGQYARRFKAYLEKGEHFEQFVRLDLIATKLETTK